MSARCLVVHAGALGDVLLAVPALTHLRGLGFSTTLAVTSRLVPLFGGSTLVDDACDIEGLGLHRLFVEALLPCAFAGVAGFDAVVCWLGAGDPTFRANLARLGRPAVVARAAPPAGSGRHASRHLVETLTPLGPLPRDVSFAPLRMTAPARAVAGTWLAARGLGAGETIVLQPGAGSPMKVWPGFPALARQLREAGLPVVTLAGPADHAAVQLLLDEGAVREDTLARDWALPEIAALLTLARAVVGNDSGPTHLAAAVGCPTVALFGPTDPAVWAPVGPGVRAIDGRADDAVWPSIGRVAAALEVLLARPAGRRPSEPQHAGARDPWR